MNELPARTAPSSAQPQVRSRLPGVAALHDEHDGLLVHHIHRALEDTFAGVFDDDVCAVADRNGCDRGESYCAFSVL